MTNTKKKGMKSIATRLDEDVCKEIARIGFFGETRSDVIRRILAMHKRGRNSHDKLAKYEDALNKL